MRYILMWCCVQIESEVWWAYSLWLQVKDIDRSMATLSVLWDLLPGIASHLYVEKLSILSSFLSSFLPSFHSILAGQLGACLTWNQCRMPTSHNFIKKVHSSLCPRSGCHANAEKWRSLVRLCVAHAGMKSWRGWQPVLDVALGKWWALFSLLSHKSWAWMISMRAGVSDRGPGASGTFKRKSASLREEAELENLLLGCDTGMVSPREIPVRIWKDGLQKLIRFSQEGGQHIKVSGVPSSISSHYKEACSGETWPEGPHHPHHLWAWRAVYPEPAHRLLLFLQSENHTRAFKGRTWKPSNPYLQMRHFWTSWLISDRI